MKKIAFFALIVGLAFVGCDTGNGNDSGNGDEFVSSINDTISNDIVTLGLVGTSVSSNNSNVVTVEIVTGKLKITSVSEGSAVITVSVGLNNATINVTVLKTGTIIIGTITKYSDPPNNNPKIVTLNNFSVAYAGEWQLWLAPDAILDDPTSIVAMLQVVPSSGTLTGNLLALDFINGPPFENWTGYGEYYIYLVPRQPGSNPDVDCYRSKNKINIHQTTTVYSFTGNFDDIGKASQFAD